MNAKKVWCLIDPQTNSQAGIKSFEKCIKDLKHHGIEYSIIKNHSDLKCCCNIENPVFIAFATSKTTEEKTYYISTQTNDILSSIDLDFSEEISLKQTFLMSLSNIVIGEIRIHLSVVHKIVVKTDGWIKFDDFRRDSKKVETLYDLAGNVIAEVGQTKTGLPCQKENSNRSRPMLACRRLHLLP